MAKKHLYSRTSLLRLYAKISRRCSGMTLPSPKKVKIVFNYKLRDLGRCDTAKDGICVISINPDLHRTYRQWQTTLVHEMVHAAGWGHGKKQVVYFDLACLYIMWKMNWEFV